MFSASSSSLRPVNSRRRLAISFTIVSADSGRVSASSIHSSILLEKDMVGSLGNDKYTSAIPSMKIANCITVNVTLRKYVASRKVLLSDRQISQSEEHHDEPGKQARIIGSCATQIPESEQG